MSDQEPLITAFVCPPRCPDGEHYNLATVPLYGPTGKVCGESVACSKCGSSAFERDLLVLP